MDTALEWTGQFKTSGTEHYLNYGLYVLYLLFPLIALAGYYILEAVLVLHVLGEKRPMSMSTPLNLVSSPILTHHCSHPQLIRNPLRHWSNLQLCRQCLHLRFHIRQDRRISFPNPLLSPCCGYIMVLLV